MSDPQSVCEWKKRQDDCGTFARGGLLPDSHAVAVLSSCDARGSSSVNASGIDLADAQLDETTAPHRISSSKVHIVSALLVRSLMTFHRSVLLLASRGHRAPVAGLERRARRAEA